MRRRPRASIVALSALAVGAVLPSVVHAQGGPGFLFKRPSATIRFETGYGLQVAGGDVFDFTRGELTIGRRDFDAPYLGAEFGFRASERLDIAVGVGFVQASVASESRDFIGTDDLPIEQVTEFRTLPVVLSARYFFADRGRSVGRFAWIPTRFVPYLGGGVGIVSYRFHQSGEFVDYETLDIFHDSFDSSGETTLVRALAGATYSLGKQFELVGEARYDWASAVPGTDFDDFHNLDLNGFQAVIGIGIRIS